MTSTPSVSRSRVDKTLLNTCMLKNGPARAPRLQAKLSTAMARTPRIINPRVNVTATVALESAVLPVGEVVSCGNGLIAYADSFAVQDFAKHVVSGVMPHASQVARLARDAFKLGKTVAARDAQPFYLRNKIALTTNERALKAAKAAA